MKTKFTLFLLCLTLGLAHAAKVDTLAVPSQAMGKSIKTVVIQPDNPQQKELPTLYLLHGYSGNYSNWVNNVPQLKEWVDKLQMLVVCPDGGFGSWYWDVPGDQNYQYETFVSKELLNFVEARFPVIKDRNKRGITGLSMGGHGALYLAIRHQDVYAAAGSTAGGVDIRPFPNNWEMSKRIGEYSSQPETWNAHTVMEMTHLIKPNSLQLFIDCGTEDFFYAVNCKFHEKLSYLNIPHRFLTMPGGHNWDYWGKSIGFQMMFFQEFFAKKG